MKITIDKISAEIIKLAIKNSYGNQDSINHYLQIAKQTSIGEFSALFRTTVKGIDFDKWRVNNPDKLEESADNYLEKLEIKSISEIKKLMARESIVLSQPVGSNQIFELDKIRNQKADIVKHLSDAGVSVLEKKITVALGSKKSMTNTLVFFKEDRDFSATVDVRRRAPSIDDYMYVIEVWTPEDKFEDVITELEDRIMFDNKQEGNEKAEFISIERILPLIPGMKDSVDLQRAIENKAEMDLHKKQGFDL